MSALQIVFNNDGDSDVIVGSIDVEGCYESFEVTTTTTIPTTTPPFVCEDLENDRNEYDYAEITDPNSGDYYLRL